MENKSWPLELQIQGVMCTDAWCWWTLRIHTQKWRAESRTTKEYGCIVVTLGSCLHSPQIRYWTSTAIYCIHEIPIYNAPSSKESYRLSPLPLSQNYMAASGVVRENFHCISKKKRCVLAVLCKLLNELNALTRMYAFPLPHQGFRLHAWYLPKASLLVLHFRPGYCHV